MWMVEPHSALWDLHAQVAVLRFVRCHPAVPRCKNVLSARLHSMAHHGHGVMGETRHGAGADKRSDEIRQEGIRLLMPHVDSRRSICQCRSRRSAISDLSIAVQSRHCQTSNAMLRSLLSAPAKLSAAAGQRYLYSSEAVTATLFPGLLTRFAIFSRMLSYAVRYVPPPG